MVIILVTYKNEEDPIKTKALEWPQYFTNYNPMGAICAMETGGLIQTGQKPNAAFPPPK